MVRVLFRTLDNPNITCGEVQRILKDIESIHVPLSIAKVNGEDMACFKCEERGTVYGYAGGEWGEDGVWSKIDNFKHKHWDIVEDDNGGIDYRCPRCREKHFYQSNYCPECGLKLGACNLDV